MRHVRSVASQFVFIELRDVPTVELVTPMG